MHPCEGDDQQRAESRRNEPPGMLRPHPRNGTRCLEWRMLVWQLQGPVRRYGHSFRCPVSVRMDHGRQESITLPGERLNVYGLRGIVAQRKADLPDAVI